MKSLHQQIAKHLNHDAYGLGVHAAVDKQQRRVEYLTVRDVLQAIDKAGYVLVAKKTLRRGG